MVKLPEVWKTAMGLRSPTSSEVSSPAALLTDADLDLDNGDFNPDDPDLPDFVRDRLKEKQHEKQIAAESEHQQAQVSAAARHDDDSGRRMREWLASEQYRRAIQELTSDVDDARAVTREAYARALKKEREAEDAFDEARNRSLVLADGRRVFFSRDGSHLISEDDVEITDKDRIVEARRLHRDNPDATTHEEFIERRKARAEADANAEQLRARLEQLDDIDRELKQGDVSPERLAELRQQQQDIVKNLPPEAREEYERLHTARKDGQKLSYKAADPAFASAPAVCKAFCEAGAKAAERPAENTAPQPPSRQPVYKAAPDYFSPEG